MIYFFLHTIYLQLRAYFLESGTSTKPAGPRGGLALLQPMSDIVYGVLPTWEVPLSFEVHDFLLELHNRVMIG